VTCTDRLLGCREHKPCLTRQTITTPLLAIANRSVSRSLLAWVCWYGEGEEACEGKMFRPVLPDCRSEGCDSRAAADPPRRLHWRRTRALVADTPGGAAPVFRGGSSEPKRHHERRGGSRRSCAPALRGCIRQQRRRLRGERTASGRARRSSSVPPSPRRWPLPLALRLAGGPWARCCPAGPTQAAERFAGDQWFAAQVAVVQTVEGRFGRLHLCFHGVPLVALEDRYPLLTRRCEAGRP
jgi:hypothetical protein